MSILTGNAVVARYRDGRVLKGITRDFAPAKSRFHLFAGGDETVQAVEIDVAELKAVFFVKSYEGDPARQDEYDFDAVRGQGRRVLVTFADGETVAGYTMGYAKNKPGFFVIPADDAGNNSRIFILVAATSSIEFRSTGDSLAANA